MGIATKVEQAKSASNKTASSPSKKYEKKTAEPVVDMSIECLSMRDAPTAARSELRASWPGGVRKVSAIDRRFVSAGSSGELVAGHYSRLTTKGIGEATT